MLVKECNLSIVRPFDYQALGEAPSHLERISTLHLPNTYESSYFLFASYFFSPWIYIRIYKPKINRTRVHSSGKIVKFTAFSSPQRFLTSSYISRSHHYWLWITHRIFVREKIMNALKQERSPQGDEGIVEKQVTWIVLVYFYFI